MYGRQGVEDVLGSHCDERRWFDERRDEIGREVRLLRWRMKAMVERDLYLQRPGMSSGRLYGPCLGSEDQKGKAGAFVPHFPAKKREIIEGIGANQRLRARRGNKEG